jgi:hypothetical protein
MVIIWVSTEKDCSRLQQEIRGDSVRQLQIDQIHQSLKRASSTLETKIQRFTAMQPRKQQYGRTAEFISDFMFIGIN